MFKVGDRVASYLKDGNYNFNGDFATIAFVYASGRYLLIFDDDLLNDTESIRAKGYRCCNRLHMVEHLKKVVANTAISREIYKGKIDFIKGENLYIKETE